MAGGVDTLKREARVAFSRRAQPVWFRIAKWTIIIVLVAMFWRRPTFWLWVLAAFAASLALHLLWRWKTRGWTQPWGGWDDVETADGKRKP
jgi:hypothetical protein